MTDGARFEATTLTVPHQSVGVVCLKAFGDFVIAAQAVRSIEATIGSGPKLLVGSHLRAIHQVLQPSCPTRWIEHGEDGVPALFDIKKFGMKAALRSALRLRQLLRPPEGIRLLFDRFSIRERFIAGNHSTQVLPRASNIYLAYSTFFDHQIRTRCIANDKRPALVGIFPGSRIAAKSMPCDVIASLVHRSRAIGLPACVFKLQNEDVDVPKNVDLVVVPKSFSAMMQAIRLSSLVLSADSMPAHLAEHEGKPVFVVSPVPNEYWLPLSSFKQSNWCTFDKISTDIALDRFLSQL